MVKIKSQGQSYSHQPPCLIRGAAKQWPSSSTQRQLSTATFQRVPLLRKPWEECYRISPIELTECTTYPLLSTARRCTYYIRQAVSAIGFSENVSFHTFVLDLGDDDKLERVVGPQPFTLLCYPSEEQKPLVQERLKEGSLHYLWWRI